MSEVTETIERVNSSHLPGRAMTATELMQAATILDAAPDKTVPGFATARKRVEGQLEELGY
jgi:hypothetical protein